MNTTSELEAEALESASRRVANMLQYPEILDRLDLLRIRTSRKRAAIETRLKTAVQSQLDDVKQGIYLLKMALEDVEEIRSDVKSVEEQYLSCAPLRNHAKKARTISTARLQLRGTMEQLEQIFNVPETVDEIRGAIGDPSANLLKVHHQIAALEACRDALMQQMLAPEARAGSSATSSSKRLVAVETYFKSVEVLANQLEQRLWFELQDPLQLVRDNPKRLVTCLRIIVREENHDTLTKEALAAGGVKAASSFRVKRLREQFFEKLALNIEARFDSKLFVSNVPRFVSSFDAFFWEDLMLAKNELPKRFPEDFDIFFFYVCQYHTKLGEMLDNLNANEELDASQVMNLLHWIPEYNKVMRDRMGIDLATLPRQLLDCTEDQLRDKYVAMLGVKLDNWSERLVQSERDSWFKAGTSSVGCPDVGPDGLYFTDAPINLFKMLDPQVGVALKPDGTSQFRIDLLRQCSVTFRKYFKGIKDGIQSVKTSYFGPEPAERPEFFFELMIATANNNAKAKDFVKMLLEDRLAGHHDQDRPDFKVLCAEFAEISQGLLVGGVFATQVVLEIIMADLMSSFEQLFTAKWLRSQAAIKTIKVTIDDYGHEVLEHLHSLYIKPLMGELQRRIMIEYVKAFLSKRISKVIATPTDRDDMLDQINKDQDKLKAAFSPFEIPADDGGYCLNVLTLLVALIECKEGMIVLNWKKIRYDFPDITLHHLETILTMRADFDPKTVRLVPGPHFCGAVMRSNMQAKALIKTQLMPKESMDARERNARIENGVQFFKLVPVNTSSIFLAKEKGEKE